MSTPASPIPMPRRRLLVRGVNWLGDAVMTTPALQRLREALPQTHITLLTPGPLAELWAGHPAIDEVISFAPGEGVWSVAGRVRAQGFDTALVLPNSPRSALEVWLARIPRRVGGAWPWRNWFLTEVIPPRPDAVRMRKLSTWEIRRRIRAPQALEAHWPPGGSAHQIHHYLHLAAALGANRAMVTPRLYVSEAETEAAVTKFGLQPPSPPGRPLFGMHPGAAYGPAKRWPAEQFIAAAREVQRRIECTWIIVGDKSDLPLTGQLQSALAGPDRRVHNLAGQTTLRALAAVLKLCRVLLTNDSGPMHLAAALGVRVVALFGSTSPALTGPGRPEDPRHRVLRVPVPCSPCFRRTCPIDLRCLRGIDVPRVVDAVIAAAQE